MNLGVSQPKLHHSVARHSVFTAPTRFVEQMGMLGQYQISLASRSRLTDAGGNTQK
jgi:hypothetical protein